MILAGDIGGTNARLALFEVQNSEFKLANIEIFPSRHYSGLDQIVSEFVKTTNIYPTQACFGIAGPGSTNLLTGLYDAKVDRAPVLALSGQVPSKVLGRGAFQDVDLNAAFAAVARSTHCVLADSDHAELVNLAPDNYYPANLQSGKLETVITQAMEKVLLSDKAPTAADFGDLNKTIQAQLDVPR